MVKVDPDHYFFDFTKEELERASDILVDSDEWYKAVENNEILADFAHNNELRELLAVWYDNNCDMVATKLMVT